MKLRSLGKSLWLPVLVGLLWLGCSILTYGIVLAFWQRGFAPIAVETCQRDRAYAFTHAVFGPLGVAYTLFLVYVPSNTVGWQGLLWRCLSPEDVAQNVTAPNVTPPQLCGAGSGGGR